MKFFAILSMAVFAAFVVAQPLEANDQRTDEVNKGGVCPWAPPI